MAMKTKNPQKDTSILPVDVVETILSRLPVKSLLRFKTVSKSWQNTISDPRFVEVVRIQQSKSQNRFLIWRPTPDWHSGCFSLIKFENQEFQIESVLGIPFGPAITLCSCNGIVLLVLQKFHNFYVLWNPSIRRHTMLWCRHTLSDYPINFGLYHDPRMDDYKVVIIAGKCYSVYSCKNRTWAEEKPFPCSGVLDAEDGVFVDGSFYWWLSAEEREYYKAEIVCFDLRDEKLKKLQQPNDLKANDTDKVRLTRLTGRLCLCCMNKYWTKLQLWVMVKNGDQKNSWRELMRMEKEEPQICFGKPICLTNEDNVVILLRGSRFVTYNHCEKRFEEIRAISSDSYYDLIHPCSESLFFPSRI